MHRGRYEELSIATQCGYLIGENRRLEAVVGKCGRCLGARTAIRSMNSGGLITRCVAPPGHWTSVNSPRPLTPTSSGATHWQLGNLNDVIRVLQLNEPDDFRYSVVNQNVQSSIGSTVIAL